MTIKQPVGGPVWLAGGTVLGINTYQVTFMTASVYMRQFVIRNISSKYLSELNTSLCHTAKRLYFQSC